jgi:hypothetical protein
MNTLVSTHPYYAMVAAAGRLAEHVGCVPINWRYGSGFGSAYLYAVAPKELFPATHVFYADGKLIAAYGSVSEPRIVWTRE